MNTGLPLVESRTFSSPLIGYAVNTTTYQKEAGAGLLPEFSLTSVYKGWYLSPLSLSPSLIQRPISTLSLLSLTATHSGNAVVTAAKASSLNPSNLIVRVYQPTNTPIPVVLRVNFSPLRSTIPTYVTALERPISNNGTKPIAVKYVQ